MEKYILAHDLGTSGNKATLYDSRGKLRTFQVCSYPTYYPFANAVEQDPNAWWAAVCESTRQVLAAGGVPPESILGVTFSGQMMGCVLVDSCGESLRNAIIWADSRAGVEEEFLRSILPPREFYQITGHRPAAFYSLAKLLWVRENEPEIFAKAYKMLNAKDFIIQKLTGLFVTDYSDASGTNMLDIRKKGWSAAILEKTGLSSDLLPELHSSMDIVGQVTEHAAQLTGLPPGTPVVMGGGDGSCAAVGAGVAAEGSAYVVIGSSSWIANASRQPVYNNDMLTFNWVALDPSYYTPCGTMQAAGYSIQWLRDTLCAIDEAEAGARQVNVYDVINEKIAASPPGANGILYLPYLLGERSPRWNAQAKGCFLNLTISTTRGDLLRAVLEGVAFNLKVILDLISENQPIEKITAIGGGAKNGLWLQIMADIWRKPVEALAYVEEATSLGAAVCAGTALGIFSGMDAARQFNPVERTYYPNLGNGGIYDMLYQEFNEAYINLYGRNHG